MSGVTTTGTSMPDGVAEETRGARGGRGSAKSRRALEG